MDIWDARYREVESKASHDKTFLDCESVFTAEDSSVALH